MKISSLLMLVALAACSHASASDNSSDAQTATAACPTPACPLLKQVNLEGGIACSVNGVVGTPLYSALLNVSCDAYQPEENTIAGGGVDGCLHPPKYPWLHA